MKKINLFLPTLIATVASLSIASIGATYAWYQYQTFVSINLGGTSIDTTKLFEIGLVSDVQLDVDKYGLSYEKIGDKNIYWVNSASTAGVTNYYLERNGYGTDQLEGVTSGKYTTGSLTSDGKDAFFLKKAPNSLDNYYHPNPGYYDYASKQNYLHFDFAFRLTEKSPEGSSIVENIGVRLSNFDFESSEGELANAVRLHFCDEDNPESSFIYNPSSVDDGQTTVGGVLDLINSGNYDTIYRNGSLYEYAYGEYETLVYNDEKTTDGSDVDIFDAGNGNSFVANHLNNAYAVNQEETVWSTCDYLGAKTVISKERRIASSGADGIAYFSMDIYLEGWSEVFINKEMDHYFKCNIGFESI